MEKTLYPSSPHEADGGAEGPETLWPLSLKRQTRMMKFHRIRQFQTKYEQIVPKKWIIIELSWHAAAETQETFFLEPGVFVRA